MASARARQLEFGWVPRDFWLEDWEKQAIIDFHLKNSMEGYRRLTFMMLDADIVAVSPTSVRRVLRQARLLSTWNSKPSKKGTGFEQPLAMTEADIQIILERAKELHPKHPARNAAVAGRGAKAAADSPAPGCVKTECAQSCKPKIEEGAMAESPCS